MTKKKAYPPEFKAKVVRELVEGDDNVSIVASRYHLSANMISGGAAQLFNNASIVFSQEQTIRENALRWFVWVGFRENRRWEHETLPNPLEDD